MKLEFRTKNTYYGHANYLCIDTDAKTVSTVPTSWISKEMPIVTKRAMDYFKQLAIADGYANIS